MLVLPFCIRCLCLPGLILALPPFLPISAQASTSSEELAIPIVPGTGRLVHRVDFEAPGSFNYGLGWAGTGFGLTGTQRGAPEEIWQDTPPPGGIEGSTRALFFRRLERTAEWYEKHPEAVGHPVYGEADPQNQDDFYVNAGNFSAAQRFSITVRVYVNLSRTARASFGLRTTAIVENTNTNPSEMRNVWPAVWLFKEDGGNGVFSDLRAFIRTPYGNYSEYIDLPDIPGWWTLGMSFDESGDIHYFARPGVEDLRSEDYLASASRYGSGRFFRHNRDATVMISTANYDTSEEGSIQIMDDILIHVNGLDFYDLWAAEHFPSEKFNHGRARDTAAPGFDSNESGRSNYEEYLFGYSPVSAETAIGPLLEAEAGDLYLTLPGIANRHYTLQSSMDLINWSASAESFEGDGEPIRIIREMPSQPTFYRLLTRPTYWVTEMPN